MVKVWFGRHLKRGVNFILSKLNITTQNANALAILGYAAAAIMCEKLP
jgi:hypothetical protein